MPNKEDGDVVSPSNERRDDKLSSLSHALIQTVMVWSNPLRLPVFDGLNLVGTPGPIVSTKKLHRVGYI
jgi:hypothetical protein